MGQASAVWKRGFVMLQVDANGANVGDGLDSTRTRAGVTVVSQDIGRHTLIAHAEGGLLTNPKPGREFDPWIEQRSPRLFGIHDFTGTRMTWFVLEDRILLVDEILGSLRPGHGSFCRIRGRGIPIRRAPTGRQRGSIAPVRADARGSWRSGRAGVWVPVRAGREGQTLGCLTKERIFLLNIDLVGLARDGGVSGLLLHQAAHVSPARAGSGGRAVGAVRRTHPLHARDRGPTSSSRASRSGRRFRTIRPSASPP